MVTTLKSIIILFVFALLNKFCKSEDSFLRTLYDPSTDAIYDNLFYVRNIECSAFTNCPAPNVCLDYYTCKCANGYVEYNLNQTLTNTTTTAYCQYKQKSQLSAFLLQFFVFHGAGQFYLGNLNYAIPQLIICLAPTIITICMYIFGFTFRKNPNDGPRSYINLIVLILNILFCCTLSAWWLAEVIILGMNKYNDENGIPLRSW